MIPRLKPALKYSISARISDMSLVEESGYLVRAKAAKAPHSRV
jgi:hypothetical protein